MQQFSFFSIKAFSALLIFFFFSFGNVLHVYAQTERLGALRLLESSNGFKGIQLGAYAGQAYKYKFNYMDGDSRFDADSCLKFDCSDSMLLKLTNDLSLDMVGIRTYKGRIVNIYLFFKLSDGYKMLSNFLGTYGMFTSRRDSYSNAYYWDTERVNLALLYAVRVDLGVAIFTSKSVQNEMKRKHSPVNTKDRVLLTSE